MPTSLIEECYRRAADARRLAETDSMPSNKTNFLGMEQRWLLAARSLTSELLEPDHGAADIQLDGNGAEPFRLALQRSRLRDTANWAKMLQSSTAQRGVGSASYKRFRAARGPRSA